MLPSKLGGLPTHTFSFSGPFHKANEE